MDKDCDCVICKYHRGEVSMDFAVGYLKGQKELYELMLKVLPDMWNEDGTVNMDKYEGIIRNAEFTSDENGVLLEDLSKWELAE